MKHAFTVKYKHGFLGETTVMASDMDEAMREAVATCRFFTACVPDRYGFDDIVESVELAPDDGPVGGFGKTYRPTAHLEKIGWYL